MTDDTNVRSLTIVPPQDSTETPKRRTRPVRKSYLTPEVHKKVVDAIRAGNYRSVAARYAGIDPNTLDNWIRKGQTGDRRSSITDACVALVKDIEEAEAASEVAAVLHWRSAMPKDWKAAEKWLAVRQPERWRPREDPPLTTLNVGIGISTGRGDPRQSKPLTQLIHDNPHLIGPTMELLDQLLPVLDDSDPEPQPAAKDVTPEPDIIEGTVTEIHGEEWTETP
jgi:transposase-like protein